MYRRSITSSLILIATLLLLVAPHAFATTHLITDDGLGDFATIQAAVEAVAPGDTLLLADGTFSGTGNWDIDFGGKDLVVKSENGPGSCFIDGLEGASGAHRAFYFGTGETSASVIEEIAIVNFYLLDENGAGIWIWGASPTLRGCVFTNNVAEDTGLPGLAYGGGLCVQNGSPLIDGCYFNYNRADTYGGGLFYSGEGTPLVTGSVFWDNDSSNGGGVFVSSTHMEITDCEFEANGNPTASGGAICVSGNVDDSPVLIANCLFVDNMAAGGSGVLAELSDPTIANCTFFFNEGTAFMGSGAGLITDSIFYNENDEISESATTVQYCWVEGGYTGTGNITGTSLPLETGPLGNFYLPAGHECEDAGSDLSANVCFADAGGSFCLDERTVFASQQLDTGQVDIGYHYRRVNATYEVPGDFATIQEAIDHAIDGDWIRLSSLTSYNENIDFLGKDITVSGVSWPYMTATIHGDGTGPVVTFNNGETSNALLRYVSVTGGDGLYGGGIFIRNASPTVRDCYVHDNIGTYGGGIYCNDTDAVLEGVSIFNNEALIGGGMCVTYDDVTLTNCRIHDNLATAGTAGLGGGIYCNYGSLTMDHVEIYRNIAVGGSEPGKGGGIYRSGFAVEPTVLTSCTLHDNTADVGSGVAVVDVEVSIANSIIGWGNDGEAVSCEGTATATLTCSDVYNNEGGDWIGGIAGQEGANGNICADPIYSFPALDLFDVVAVSPCAPVNTDGCGLIGALYDDIPAVTVPVFPDGSGPFATIQEAVDGAPGGSTIQLANGVFSGDGNRDLDFDGRSLRIISASGDPDSCIVDCQGSDIEGHRFLLLDDREGGFTRIEGITVRNGYTGGGGGALYIRESHPTVENCVFEDNSANDGGAIQTYKSKGSIVDCLFRSNSAANAGGGIMNHTSHPEIIECRFEDNFGNWGGGGVYNHYSDSAIEGCVFIENSSDHWGGAIHNNHPESSSVVSNSTFSLNAAPLGGVLYSRNNAVLVVDNSILASSTIGSAAYAASGGTVTLACSDVFGNAGGDFVDALTGQEGGADNFSADPEFCDQGAGNYRLLDTSPCAPDNSGACGLVGALGTNCDAVSGVEEPVVVPSASTLHACFPNPFNPVTTIRYDVAKGGRIHLRVYDVAGRIIRVLVDESRPAGRHEVVWNGRDNTGRRVASGTYFYRLEAGSICETKKMVLIK